MIGCFSLFERARSSRRRVMRRARRQLLCRERRVMRRVRRQLPCREKKVMRRVPDFLSPRYPSARFACWCFERGQALGIISGLIKRAVDFFPSAR